MAKSKITISTSGLIALIAIAFVATAFMGINPYWKPLATTYPSGAGAVTGTLFCQGVGLVSPPYPPQCASQQVKLQITLQNLLGGSLTASKYSVRYWQNVGSPATFTAPTSAAGPQIIGGSWTILDTQKCGAAPTACTTSNGWTSGLQVAVQVCENQTPACGAGDYTAKETDYVCPLPSLAPQAIGSIIPGLQPTCGWGPGSGTIPLIAQSQNPPVTINFNLPIPAFFGSTDDGYNANSPNCIAWTWLNGTQVPAAPCSSAGSATGFTKLALTGAPAVGMGGTGSAACSGSGGCTGIFSSTIALSTGGAGLGTIVTPATPYSIAAMSYTPVDPAIATGPNARGAFTTVLSVEIKATTGTDMCFITAPWAGISATVISKTGTDTFYFFTIPDSATTLARDAGNTYSTGVLSGTLSINCAAVFSGGSTDVVTMTFNEYPYFSMAYFRANQSLNPEANAIINSSSSSALNDVLTIKQ